MDKPIPFRIDVSQTKIDEIKRRIEDYHWPPEPVGSSWTDGVPPGVMKVLVQRWASAFDWRAEEARLNDLAQYMADVDGQKIHFVHFVGGASPSAEAPLVLLHGWPSSFMEYLECAKLLCSSGGRDVVVVSLPGFGFSSAPASFMGPRAMAALVHRLMTSALGYSRYVAHGSDWGSIISGWLGFDFPDACVGVHMTMVSPRFIARMATEPHEKEWLGGFRERFDDDGAYFQLQTSRPATLGYLLNDSPVGILAWMTEKFAAWGDPAEGDRTMLYSESLHADRVIRNAMLYLVSGSAATSTWIYRGLSGETPPGFPGGKRVEVPVAVFATKDPIFVAPPRSLVEKAYRVTRWTDAKKGGHFPAYDVPADLAHDIEAFADGL